MKRDQMNERDSFFERTEQQVLFYLYEFRRLVKRLEHIGYIERFGKLTASFDRDRAMELLRIGI